MKNICNWVVEKLCERCVVIQVVAACLIPISASYQAYAEEIQRPERSSEERQHFVDNIYLTLRDGQISPNTISSFLSIALTKDKDFVDSCDIKSNKFSQFQIGRFVGDNAFWTKTQANEEQRHEPGYTHDVYGSVFLNDGPCDGPKMISFHWQFLHIDRDFCLPTLMLSEKLPAAHLRRVSSTGRGHFMRGSINNTDIITQSDTLIDCITSISVSGFFKPE